MNFSRLQHIATLLLDGRVLIVGGRNGQDVLTSAEIFDPSTGSWTVIGGLGAPTTTHTATLLTDGRVLVAGDPCRI